MKTMNYLDKIIKRKRSEVEQLIALTKTDLNHPLNKILGQNHKPRKRFANALRAHKEITSASETARKLPRIEDRKSVHISNIDRLTIFDPRGFGAVSDAEVIPLRALRDSTLSVIGEVKRSSPSAGMIRTIADPVQLALEYCKGGVSAISVLTDAEGFGGSLDDLHRISTEVTRQYPHVPILRKDFIIHPLQLAEAVLAGASAVLLIVAVLGKDIKAFIDEAARLGLETLTEVHDLAELELALQANSPIIGINHRNLTTFKVDLEISKTLRPLIPSHVISVAESGIHEVSQAKQMHQLGYNAILVGEALVRSRNPSSLITLMTGGCDES